MNEIKTILNEHYAINFDNLEFKRDGGSDSYIAFAGSRKYFLRVIKPALYDTTASGADIQVFLQERGFPVPPIIFTKTQLPYVRTNDKWLILYEFIEGNDANPEHDIDAIGTLVGTLHQIMKSYPGELVVRDKQFYIGRYIDVLHEKKYKKTNEYIAYGDAIWEKIKDLPRGYCHGDMYEGNIRKTDDGKLYLHDFDTSCNGFPMYDPAIICDVTDYFEFNECDYYKSNELLAQFISEYQKHNPLSQGEIDAFHAIAAIQHFSTQATIMELYGLDSLDDTDMDNQLDWLYKWRSLCRGNNIF